MGELSIDVDEANSRIYLELSGNFDGEEASEVTDRVIGAATRLDDEFDMINDISGLQAGDVDSLEHLTRAKEGLADEGLHRVVRIMPVARSSQKQYTDAGEDEATYEIMEAGSVEEAEQLLDE